MAALSPDVRLLSTPHMTPGTLYYECKRCRHTTKTYRKMKRHLHRCAASSRGTRPAAETLRRLSLDEESRRP